MTRVFTTGQVAKIFSVNINTVIKWFDDGKLEGFRLPRSNERRIYRESVLEFMKEHDISLDLLQAFDDERRSKRGRRGADAARQAPPAKTGSELRTFPRKPVDLVARVESTVGEMSAKVKVRNISMGGVFLTGFGTSHKLIPTEFRLKVDTGDERGTLDGVCQLVHLRRVDDESMAFGCRFTQVDPGSLQSYLASV
jgi:excisionase family DNA binding protein